MPVQMDIPRIKYFLAREDTRQYELAKKAGISHHYFYDIMRGKRNPSLRVARQLAKALGVTVDEIMRANDETRVRSLPTRSK